MGLKFRKSIKLPGGFRINISSKGVGASWGVKGFRVTKRADGSIEKTVSIPGTGIYKRERISDTPEKQNANSQCYQPTEEQLQRQAEIKELLSHKERPNPYEHIRFYATETHGKNSDGTDRQELLYLYKMKRPPFDGPCEQSITIDDEDVTKMGICLNGHLIGYVPPDEAQMILDNEDRVDQISHIDILGRKNNYDAQVTFRFFKSLADDRL